jgi:predicted transposase/invertase (TIGR01784 family)
MAMRYMDPKTDFGFKRLFGSEDSKDILKKFLYDMLALPHPIAELSYLPTEQLPRSPIDRASIYDLYCVDDTGQHFIVEMQRNAQHHYRERALYYITFPITQQAQKGDQAPFALPPLYSLNLLNFRIDDQPTHLRRVQLAETATGRVFYDKLTFVYVELPKFQKREHELSSETDKWLYLLRHMPELSDIPRELQQAPYTQVFHLAELLMLSETERYYYEGSLKVEWDRVGQIETAREEGRLAGLRDTVRRMRAAGLDTAAIAQFTGLSVAEVGGLS